MNRLIKILLAPILVLAMIGSTVYLGVIRGGAMTVIVNGMTADESVRATMASAFVDTLVEDETGVIGILIDRNREQVEQTVADTLAQPEQRQQLAQSAQQWIDAMLAGDRVVEVDSRPLFRPIYRAVGELLPILQFTEKDIAELDPIVLGADEPLPDLRPVRNAAGVGLLLWLVWLALAAALLRRGGRRAAGSIAWQMLSIGTVGLLIILSVPRLLASLAGEASSQALVRTVLTSLTAPGAWMASVLIISGLGLLFYRRGRPDAGDDVSGEGVLPGEGAADTQ